MIDSPAYRNLEREKQIQQSIDRELQFTHQLLHPIMSIFAVLAIIFVLGIFVLPIVLPVHTIPAFITVPYFLLLAGTWAWFFITLRKIKKELMLQTKLKSEMELWIIE